MMTPTVEEKPTYRDYTELWSFNLRTIEQVQRHIEKSIHDLEMKYADFEPVYDEIIGQVDILSSIYSSFNMIDGAESVIRLKSVLESYRKNYTREGLNFNLIHHLLIKINEARDMSFSEFPRLEHDDRPVVVPIEERPVKDYTLMRHRWITFERNRSWFITPFTSVDIRTSRDCPVASFEHPDQLIVECNGAIVKIKDIFGKRGDPVRPIFYILLDGASRNFAATAVGKRIYADRDIITRFLRPFRTVESNPISPGRARLFGINHIILNRQ